MTITEHASTNSPVIRYLFTAVYVLTIYNAAETMILVFVTFRKYSGCYFWSLIVATSGLLISTFGSAYYFYVDNANEIVPVSLGVFGWAAFVPGQAVVLWSRLHLVIQNIRIIRGVLIMIIVNAAVLCPPTIVLAYLGTVPHPDPKVSHAYNIWENIQLSIFCTQESVISGIYIWQTILLLKLVSNHRKRIIIYQLLAINVCVLGMDAVLLGVQYSSYKSVQIQTKGFVYSLKLKLELAVLSRLVSFVRQSHEKEQLPSDATVDRDGSGLGVC
ncbi:hypothetical protein ABOM_006665 [Aspergillus bombycis]|uniref:DUF7703 domain-containing protein n=1 Tax=Aspergillus bombycis TaxID=109264 RepID=A0A1F8A0B2_9EURO|nr:hypothetical protein ABOM_006665 [Aspergillus bombycis]OGM45141.1 hypothetical protein ABOM_006665 [Aspergillus bombycis]